MLLLRFSRQYLARYALWYLLGTLALIATNWLSVTIPLYLADGIDALMANDGTGLAHVRQNALIIAGMGLLITVVRTASRLMFFTPGRLVEARLKRDLFSRLLEQQPTFVRQWPVGDLVSRASSDVTFLRLLAGFAALQLVNVTVALILTGIQMVRISPILALWVSLPILVALVVTRLFLGQLFRLVKQLQAQEADLSDFILSSYQGIATISAFGAEDAFLERFNHKNRSLLRSTLKRANLRTVVGPILSLAAALNVCLLIYFGGTMAIEGGLSVGDLVAFITLIAYLTVPLRSLSFLLSLLKQAEVAAGRLAAVLLPEPERPDKPYGRPPPDVPPTISIQNLTFSYPDSPEQLVLKDIDLEIPAGSTLGVLGLTGSGKTTLLRCISRLYNPPPSTVALNGIDVLTVDLDAWRRQMTLVPQRAFLFSESLKDNIILGNDEGKLSWVTKATTLDVDIASLSEGVSTQVGESGVRLSGGQRQRVALARGLIRQTTVLLLDDVLSAVDHETERELITTLRGAAIRPTTIMVSHRISALQHADQIIVLDSGSLVARGTHKELCRQPGLYRDTWEHQGEAE
ncbi:MAG: ABC transporter ATP-binding protein [Proteobacteria bacterium]|nr:ABC transporter ATP-binding protein [Pseudomonadota bacterium]